MTDGNRIFFDVIIPLIFEEISTFSNDAIHRVAMSLNQHIGLVNKKIMVVL